MIADKVRGVIIDNMICCEVITTYYLPQATFSFFIPKLCSTVKKHSNQMAAEQKTPNGASDPNQNPSTTLYHIYHTGFHNTSYSLHIIPDSHTTLILNPSLPSPIIKRRTSQASKSPQTSPSNSFPLIRRKIASLSKAPSSSLTKAQKAKLFDKPDHDPRCTDGSAPYFVHLPTLTGHSPP